MTKFCKIFCVKEQVQGNEIESEIFPKLSLTEFVQRLLDKRCCCMDGRDVYVLLDGTWGRHGFEEIGTEFEKEPLTLKNVISYNEVKLSALLSVSSHTDFINDGNRYNCGKVEADKSKIEQAGVVIGLIGSRFTRENYMDWQDIVITETQNTTTNGYGAKANVEHNRASDYRRVWNDFYEEHDFTHDEAKCLETPRLHKYRKNIFDNLIMKKRFTISFDTLLLEAESRAAKAGKFAYVHVVGIGLGVWRVLDHQSEIFLETFAQRLKALMPVLNHIGAVHFSWFYMSEWQDLKDGGFYASATHPKGGIKTFLSNRNPSEKLPAEFHDMFVVESYAWDGNAMPGNEFWVGSLCGSGDPAAAASTLISELHNPLINSEMVNGANLHIATLKHGVMHIKDYCNKLELEIYPKLTLTDFVQRLLEKRCVAFVGPMDSYLLIDGSRGDSSRYEKIGTPAEVPPLVLQNVISYDEVKLSALLSVSSHTEFLNNGDRYNAGRIEQNKSKSESEGVIIGLIGGRFERDDVMEWQDVMITRTQNTREHGYGYKAGDEMNKANDYRRIWNDFYETKDFLYEEAANSNEPRFHKVIEIFDNIVMKKRYAISFDTLLLEADARAEKINKLAYVHVVGIGLGVWKISPHQKLIFLETFAERIQALITRLQHVGVVHFSHFGMKEFGDLKDDAVLVSETHPKGGIKIFMHDRNPAAKLPAAYEDMFVVESYAWDGNALPGNEFWLGSLSGSGDPAAACSTLITELHNPHINTEMTNGKNLHIATLNHGVLHIKDYCQTVLKLF